MKTVSQILTLLVALLVAGSAENKATGEKQFLIKLQPIRVDMLQGGLTKEESAFIDEHYYRLKELTKKGVVILAGRTLNTDQSSFGIVIFRADSEEAAREIMNGDPAVKNGVMKATLFSFQVALMEGKPLD
jgi:uncharacterized protein YciI